MGAINPNYASIGTALLDNLIKLMPMTLSIILFIHCEKTCFAFDNNTKQVSKPAFIGFLIAMTGLSIVLNFAYVSNTVRIASDVITGPVATDVYITGYYSPYDENNLGSCWSSKGEYAKEHCTHITSSHPQSIGLCFTATQSNCVVNHIRKNHIVIDTGPAPMSGRYENNENHRKFYKMMEGLPKGYKLEGKVYRNTGILVALNDPGNGDYKIPLCIYVQNEDEEECYKYGD